MSTYPLSKTENSSDLVHYFLGWASNSPLKIKIKLEIGIAKHCLGAKIVVYACL